MNLPFSRTSRFRFPLLSMLEPDLQTMRVKKGRIRAFFAVLRNRRSESAADLHSGPVDISRRLLRWTVTRKEARFRGAESDRLEVRADIPEIVRRRGSCAEILPVSG